MVWEKTMYSYEAIQTRGEHLHNNKQVFLVGAHELFELQAYPTLSHGKSYVFYELPIRMNLYQWPTPNPAPKPTRHWGLDKSYEWGRTNSYELATS